MAVEAQTKNQSNSVKEFEKLLNEDFKDRKLKENQIIKATVTEITKNFIVVDCKAKMELAESKEDKQLLEKSSIRMTKEHYDDLKQLFHLMYGFWVRNYRQISSRS